MQPMQSAQSMRMVHDGAESRFAISDAWFEAVSRQAQRSAELEASLVDFRARLDSVTFAVADIQETSINTLQDQVNTLSKEAARQARERDEFMLFAADVSQDQSKASESLAAVQEVVRILMNETNWLKNFAATQVGDDSSPSYSSENKNLASHLSSFQESQSILEKVQQQFLKMQNSPTNLNVLSSPEKLQAAQNLHTQDDPTNLYDALQMLGANSRSRLEGEDQRSTVVQGVVPSVSPKVNDSKPPLQDVLLMFQEIRQQLEGFKESQAVLGETQMQAEEAQLQVKDLADKMVIFQTRLNEVSDLANLAAQRMEQVATPRGGSLALASIDSRIKEISESQNALSCKVGNVDFASFATNIESKFADLEARVNHKQADLEARVNHKHDSTVVDNQLKDFQEELHRQRKDLEAEVNGIMSSYAKVEERLIETCQRENVLQELLISAQQEVKGSVPQAVQSQPAVDLQSLQEEARSASSSSAKLQEQLLEVWKQQSSFEATLTTISQNTKKVASQMEHNKDWTNGRVQQLEDQLRKITFAVDERLNAAGKHAADRLLHIEGIIQGISSRLEMAPNTDGLDAISRVDQVDLIAGMVAQQLEGVVSEQIQHRIQKELQDKSKMGSKGGHMLNNNSQQQTKIQPQLQSHMLNNNSQQQTKIQPQLQSHIGVDDESWLLDAVATLDEEQPSGNYATPADAQPHSRSSYRSDDVAATQDEELLQLQSQSTPEQSSRRFDATQDAPAQEHFHLQPHSIPQRSSCRLDTSWGTPAQPQLNLQSQSTPQRSSYRREPRSRSATSGNPLGQKPPQLYSQLHARSSRSSTQRLNGAGFESVIDQDHQSVAGANPLGQEPLELHSQPYTRTSEHVPLQSQPRVQPGADANTPDQDQMKLQSLLPSSHRSEIEPTFDEAQAEELHQWLYAQAHQPSELHQAPHHAHAEQPPPHTETHTHFQSGAGKYDVPQRVRGSSGFVAQPLFLLTPEQQRKQLEAMEHKTQATQRKMKSQSGPKFGFQRSASHEELGRSTKEYNTTFGRAGTSPFAAQPSDRRSLGAEPARISQSLQDRSLAAAQISRIQDGVGHVAATIHDLELAAAAEVVNEDGKFKGRETSQALLPPSLGRPTDSNLKSPLTAASSTPLRIIH